MKKFTRTVYLALMMAGTLNAFNAKAQIIWTTAGNGTSGYSGDGGYAQSAELTTPYGVAVDGNGNLYVADENNQRIRKVTPTGIITTFAGNGNVGPTGNGGPATAAALSYPQGIAVDGNNNVYLCEIGENQVRKITASTGVITLFAGVLQSTGGYSGDGGQATAADFNNPEGVCASGSPGNVYIADMTNNVIRKVNSSGIINTYAGNGTAGHTGDGGQATAAELDNPTGVALDASGNLYIADMSNNKVRKVTTAGVISTYAGTGTAGFSGDAGQATAAELDAPNDVKVDASGNVYIADAGNNRIRKITTAGIISTITGGGSSLGDGGYATAAELADPTAIALDASANVYIADYSHYRVRKISTLCPANAGPNMLNQEDDCGNWPGVTIGTPAVTNMSYSWTPITSLSSNNVAQPTSSWENTTTHETYSVIVSYSLCTTHTSTVQVSAATCGANCGGGCRTMAMAQLNQTAATFAVYPNPSNAEVTISLYDKTDYIRIIDMQGSIVYETQNTDAGEVKLDISSYNKGIYFVMAKIGNTLEKQKLVVE